MTSDYAIMKVEQSEIVRSKEADNLAVYHEGIVENIAASRAASTRHAYSRDWAQFEGWCVMTGVIPFPASPETVAAYITSLAKDGKAAATIGRRLAAIRFFHHTNNVPVPTSSPLVEVTLSGIRRRIGVYQQGRAAAVIEDIRAMVAILPDTLKGNRDRALLLIGFAGAFRRSELVALNFADVEFCQQGVIITLRRSKTDQEGVGMRKGIPFGANVDTCPVRALQTWISGAKIAGGPLFRTIDRHGNIAPHKGDAAGRLAGIDVARLVKKTAAAAGLDSTRYSGHSLRAGFITSAASAGVAEHRIMEQSGHKSERMVRKYIREGNIFKNNAAGEVGL